MSKIKYPELAPQGAKKIEWVRDYMPVLRALEETYRETKPFAGMRVAVCVHLEAKTAYLCQVLRAAGAEVSVTKLLRRFMPRTSMSAAGLTRRWTSTMSTSVRRCPAAPT